MLASSKLISFPLIWLHFVITGTCCSWGGGCLGCEAQRPSWHHCNHDLTRMMYCKVAIVWNLCSWKEVQVQGTCSVSSEDGGDPPLIVFKVKWEQRGAVSSLGAGVTLGCCCRCRGHGTALQGHGQAETQGLPWLGILCWAGGVCCWVLAVTSQGRKAPWGTGGWLTWGLSLATAISRCFWKACSRRGEVTIRVLREQCLCSSTALRWGCAPGVSLTAVEILSTSGLHRCLVKSHVWSWGHTDLPLSAWQQIISLAPCAANAMKKG